MRRKITKVQEEGALPDLTPQQHAFVEAKLSGKNGTEAYIAAYDAKNMLRTTIQVEASKLAANPKVAQWLSAGRMAGLASSCGPTMQEHIAELDRIKEIALKTGNVGAAAQCEQLRGKVMGHYTERVELTQDDPSVVWARLVQIMPELEHAD